MHADQCFPGGISVMHLQSNIRHDVLYDRLKFVLIYDLDHSTVLYPVVASAICKALLKYDQYITNGTESSTLKEINVVCSDREAVIIQMKTFDVFLPKLIHGGHLQTPPCNLQTPPCNLQTPTGNLQTPPGNLQTPPCISSSTEKFSETDFGISLFELKHCSNLRHVGSSLVK